MSAAELDAARTAWREAGARHEEALDAGQDTTATAEALADAAHALEAAALRLAAEASGELTHLAERRAPLERALDALAALADAATRDAELSARHGDLPGAGAAGEERREQIEAAREALEALWDAAADARRALEAL